MNTVSGGTRNADFLLHDLGKNILHVIRFAKRNFDQLDPGAGGSGLQFSGLRDVKRIAEIDKNGDTRKLRQECAQEIDLL